VTHARIPVAILGATGAVGQTFIRLLAGHPWFRVAEVAASERSVGKSYAAATRWIEGPLPAEVALLDVQPCDPATLTSPVVFSALDSAAAGDLEPAFARAGRFVLSNAKNFRMEADVPLVIPEVNAAHLSLLGTQRAARGWNGAIVTNANCAATMATMAMAPLHERFGVRTVFAATMQAVSGAGYPGVPSLDILGNVIPYIGDEEPKIESEPGKIFGKLAGNRVEVLDIAVVTLFPEFFRATLETSIPGRAAAKGLVRYRVVDLRATKPEIRSAVEQLFSVKVLDVHTLRMSRKTRRVGKTMGYKPQWKKAIVRLAEGQRIEFFEGV